LGRGKECRRNLRAKIGWREGKRIVKVPETGLERQGSAAELDQRELQVCALEVFLAWTPFL
jgi:hypothetical protein